MSATSAARCNTWANPEELLIALVPYLPANSISITKRICRNVYSNGDLETYCTYEAAVHAAHLPGRCKVYSSPTLEFLCCQILADFDMGVFTPPAPTPAATDIVNPHDGTAIIDLCQPHDAASLADYLES